MCGSRVPFPPHSTILKISSDAGLPASGALKSIKPCRLAGWAIDNLDGHFEYISVWWVPVCHGARIDFRPGDAVVVPVSQCLRAPTTPLTIAQE